MKQIYGCLLFPDLNHLMILEGFVSKKYNSFTLSKNGRIFNTSPLGDSKAKHRAV